MAYIEHEQIVKARRANLYRYAVDHLTDELKHTKSGITLNGLCDYPIWIGVEHSGFTCYSGQKHSTGNALDLLTDYLDMTIQDAVKELTPYFRIEEE